MRFCFAVLFAVLLISSADARPRHHHHQTHISISQGVVVCNQWGCDDRRRVEIRTTTPLREWGAERAVGGRHAGDPWAFCGAEASRYVFGETKRDLWPANNWITKFARALPAPGMAAARRHHVMILMSHVSGSDWMVHDGNGGGHRTWEHVRSIAGYVIVDPHSPRFASRSEYRATN